MKKTLLKNTLRTIRKNFVSWLAISVVVMMCCGMYFGTFFYAQAVAKTTNRYASRTGFEDFNLIAVAGLKENELEQLRSMDGINDVEVTVADRGDANAYDAVRSCLEEQGLEFAEARKINTVFRFGETEYFVSVIAAPERLYPNYLETTDLRGKQQYHPAGHGILVSNRLADMSGLRAGDEMEVFDEDYQPHTVPVGAVCRNYLGRNLYFSEEDYQALFGKEPEYNTFLVRMEHSARDSFREALKERFSGVSVEYTDELPDTLQGQCTIFNAVVYVVLALSILMSVFVLMNLVNIFVSRRKNEVIIMAVNGFSWNEQIGYLLKETIATTALGLLLGIAGGCAMTEYLVRIVEGEDCMFMRSVNPRAWLFAVVVETAFALIINAISFRRLKKLKLTDITK